MEENGGSAGSRLRRNMGRTIGVTRGERLAAGLVEGGELIGKLRVHKEDPRVEPLFSTPAVGIARRFAEEIRAVAAGQTVDAIGVGIPGIINCGFIEESPNLRQLKGVHMQELLAQALRRIRNHRAGIRLQRRRRPGRRFGGDARTFGSSSSASGLSAMVSALACIRGAKAFGRAATWWCRSIRASAIAAAAGWDIWRACRPSRHAAAFPGHGAG